MNPAEEARRRAMMKEAEKAGRTPMDDPPERAERAPPESKDDYARQPGESRVESMERHTHVASPHGDPTMDPATTIWDIAYMAGYGDRGQDALQGADRLVTGEADAARLLAAPSATEGRPTQLAADESLFADDLGEGHMDVFGGSEREWSDDWTEDL